MVLIFSRLIDRREETTAEVQVLRRDGQHVMRRRINLLAAGRAGSVSDLARELGEEVQADWRRILREGCESVLMAFRAGPEVVTLHGDWERPPPPTWLVDGLLLEGKPNCWLGAASTGKSTLAKAICAYYATGMRFLNRPMAQGTPLYLDWEDDEASFRRVVYDVCRNLGCWPAPRMHWLDMHGRRLRDQIELLARLVERERVSFIVLDAIAAAGGSPGEHMSWEGVALELEQALGQLPLVTVLALDHVTSAEHKDNGVVPLKARGAERKVEFFRNQWSLVADREAGASGRHLISWTHTKLNVGPRRESFVTELIHHEGDLSIVVRDIESSPEAAERQTIAQRCIRALARTPGMTVVELSIYIYGDDSKAHSESVRTQLKRAQARGEVFDAAGRWFASQPTRPGGVPDGWEVIQ